MNEKKPSTKSPTQITRDGINSLSAAITALSKASQQLAQVNNELSVKTISIWNNIHALQGAAIETLRKLQETENGKPIAAEKQEATNAPTRGIFSK